MSTAYVRQGVRYRRVRTRDNSWGPGKVHIAWWDSLNKMWMPHCRHFNVHNTDDMSKDQAVDCKECQMSSGAK